LEYNRIAGQANAAIIDFPKPTIAMIQGYCIGGGLGVALCCDLRLAAENARFAVPAAKLGLGYAYDGIKRLVDVVGPSFAKEIFYTAWSLYPLACKQLLRRNQFARHGKFSLSNGIIEAHKWSNRECFHGVAVINVEHSNHHCHVVWRKARRIGACVRRRCQISYIFRSLICDPRIAQSLRGAFMKCICLLPQRISSQHLIYATLERWHACCCFGAR
jgi:hypothetical protein